MNYGRNVITLATIRRRTCTECGGSFNTGAPIQIVLYCPRCQNRGIWSVLLDPEYLETVGTNSQYGFEAIESGDEDGICESAAAIIKADYDRAARFVEIWKESD